MEQLIGNLQLDESDWLDRFLHQVMVDKFCWGHVIKYKVFINDMHVDVLYDTGALKTCMAKRFFDTLTLKPMVLPCNRSIAGTEGEILRLVGKCFICLQIGKRVVRDWG